MKVVFFLLLIGVSHFLLGCSKKNHVADISGTINGVPATTLYGDSREAADYVLLSKDPAYMEMAYSGNIFKYTFVAGSSKIYITDSLTAIGRGSIIVSGSKTTLTIDTSYHFAFRSKTYSSD